MNKIWMIIIAFCLVYAVLTGHLDTLTDNILEVPGITIKLLLTVGGLIIIYNGIFNIAIACGLINTIGKIFSPLSYKLFPHVPHDHVIHQYVCSNITANLLGLGLASTPIALKAIQEMKKLANNTEVATSEMITLIVINITCFTLFPLTVISLREKYQSNLGIQIWIALIIITFITSVVSLMVDHFFQKVNK